MFRNERKLYKRKCDASGKDIISMYSPDKSYKIYDQKFWRSDSWDPMSYGQDFDLSKTFTEQFMNLLKKVPQVALIGNNNENSAYSNNQAFNKNCYMCFDTGRSRDCYYVTRSYTNTLCMDSLLVVECENSYQIMDAFRCTSCMFSQNISDCSFCFYSILCSGCTHCFLCSNLVNKSYCINNIQYTKEEYFELIKQFEIWSEELWKKFREMLSNVIYKNNNVSCENVFGDYLKECKDCMNSFDAQKSRNCSYISASTCLDDSYDDNFSGDGNIGNSFKNLETIGCECPKYVLFSTKCRGGCEFVMYSDFCHSCKNCFWCVWLRNKEYCILNKQYTKEEYEKLVPQIIEQMQKSWEWWEFFDPSLSHFGYNETVAQEYFSLSREKALARWYRRQDNSYDPVIPEWAEVFRWDKIPTDIRTVSDDILKNIFVCEVSWRPFRIIKQELDFYRKHNLPLPRKHPDIRHEERMRVRPIRWFHLRNCDNCGKEMISVYPKNYEWKVYCESCYKKEIYG